MVPVVLAGTAGWAVAGLVLLIFFRDWLTEHDRLDWLWTCLAGFLVGLIALSVMIPHDVRRQRRRAAR
jgi:hypothetical protein